jgi:hypothetical protein
MVVGLGEMFGAVGHFWEEHISHDGAWWILAMDGVLLIPLIFAAFFYPMPALMVAGGIVLLTGIIVGLGRLVHARQHPHR